MNNRNTLMAVGHQLSALSSPSFRAQREILATLFFFTFSFSFLCVNAQTKSSLQVDSINVKKIVASTLPVGSIAIDSIVTIYNGVLRTIPISLLPTPKSCGTVINSVTYSPSTVRAGQSVTYTVSLSDGSITSGVSINSLNPVAILTSSTGSSATVTYTAPQIVGNVDYLFRANNAACSDLKTTVPIFPPANTSICTSCGPDGVDIWVSSTDDNTAGVAWTSNTTTATNATDCCDGRVNQNMVTSDVSGAFYICKNKGTGWYLPSRAEMAAVIALSLGTSCITGIGPNYTYYWVSTEFTATQGGFIRNNGYGAFALKTTANRVRCAWRP